MLMPTCAKLQWTGQLPPFRCGLQPESKIDDVSGARFLARGLRLRRCQEALLFVVGLESSLRVTQLHASRVAVLTVATINLV